MKRLLGFTLAVVFALPLAASAEEAIGKIKVIDRADQAFVLEDGTRLWIDEGRLADLREGEKVLVTYSTKGGKKVVTELDIRAVVDGTETTNHGTATSPFDTSSFQATD